MQLLWVPNDWTSLGDGSPAPVQPWHEVCRSIVQKKVGKVFGNFNGLVLNGRSMGVKCYIVNIW